VTPDEVVGDSVPAALVEYHRALADGDVPAACAVFADDGVNATPRGDGDETAPRHIACGHREIRPGLTNLTSERRHDVQYDAQRCAVGDGTAMLEGVSRDRATGAAIGSVAASAQFADDGSIARHLLFTSTPVPLLGHGVSASAPDGRAMLERYFHALAESRVEDAASCFSDDVVYSHPPYRDLAIAGPGRATFNGRDELLAAFRRRGPQTVGYHIDVALQRGSHLLAEGVVESDGRPIGTFLSSASVGATGVLTRYVAFYCEPAVPRR